VVSGKAGKVTGNGRGAVMATKSHKHQSVARHYEGWTECVTPNHVPMILRGAVNMVQL
jgi:hypothetical protein